MPIPDMPDIKLAISEELMLLLKTCAALVRPHSRTVSEQAAGKENQNENYKKGWREVRPIILKSQSSTTPRHKAVQAVNRSPIYKASTRWNVPKEEPMWQDLLHNVSLETR